ncbi:hypothetical protein ACVBEH_31180, partial [Roseateles sp. GG27B]
MNDEVSAEDLAIAAAFAAQSSHEAAPNQPELPGSTQEKQAKQPIWKAWAARPRQYWAALRATFSRRSSAQP